MEHAEATFANLEIVRRWISAVNEKKLEDAERHSCADIEIVGPKDSARGCHVLRDWIARAGITLETRRSFARLGAVVLEQKATWNSTDTGGSSSTAILSSSFALQDGRVCRVARFNSLHAAFGDSGLTEADEVKL